MTLTVPKASSKRKMKRGDKKVFKDEKVGQAQVKMSQVELQIVIQVDCGSV
eukprot:CAMPEP_0113848950 /NCGR_PEP_ID=MMETSP0372-20130328/2802_1 /TAXON_ID=340204 /ORGANISM="Lankesteria abbotti" /LENGTH=50 /DNA_ID=CAMNT_0000818571 /DNA_START=654 /DNA_END=806 /DNA_ORIENTATION=+ /assembly_acc=CAM_ASM_000359